MDESSTIGRGVERADEGADEVAATVGGALLGSGYDAPGDDVPRRGETYRVNLGIPSVFTAREMLA